MNTLASIPRHFLRLYTSRSRQCKLGYDTSAACDSYQLGETIRFLTHKNLLHLTDFGPESVYEVPDHCKLHLEDVVATLRQFPSYQIDNHHKNCGLRIRILPILEYVQTMLASSAVAITSTAWKKREETAWVYFNNGDGDEVTRTVECDEKKKKCFRFTRAVSGDQRLRYEGALAAEKMARELFTAGEWDWTAEDGVMGEQGFPGEFRPLGLGRERRL